MNRQPNVIIFFTDQQRWDTLGLNGNPMEDVPDSKVYAETELYDLQTDPYELANLITSRPHQSVRDELRRCLLTRMQQIEGFQAEITLAEVNSISWSQRTVDDPCGESQSLKGNACPPH